MPGSTLRHGAGTTSRAAILVAVACGLLALGLRWYFVVHAQILQPVYLDGDWGDAGEYYRYAWNLVHHGIFSLDPPSTPVPESDGYRDPGYPVFLALWMTLTTSYEQWYAAVISSQVALGGMTVALTVLALRRALPAWLLGTLGVLLAVWPHIVVMTGYLLTENLSAPLLALAVFLLGEAVARRSRSLTLAAGAFLACTALTNAVIGPLVIVVASALYWRRLMPMGLAALLAATVLVPLAAWQVRNATVPQTISAGLRAEMNLVQGSWPTYHLAMQLKMRKVPAGIQTMDAINNEIAVMHKSRSQGLQLMMARMGSAPGAYLKWYLGKPVLLWGWEIGLGSGGVYVYPTHDSPFITQPLMRGIEAAAFLLNPVLAFGALVGLVLILLDREPDVPLLVFGLTAAWVTLVYWILQSDPRYAIPFRGAEFGLACWAVWCASRYTLARRDRRPAAP
jgi:hypothetical protein